MVSYVVIIQVIPLVTWSHINGLALSLIPLYKKAYVNQWVNQ